jgi:hypothetical protein
MILLCNAEATDCLCYVVVGVCGYRSRGSGLDSQNYRGFLRSSGCGIGRKLQNEEHHNLHTSPSMIRMAKSWRGRWAGGPVQMGRRGILIGYWWESQ